MQTRLHAIIAHASNATMSLRAFICVRVRLRVLFVIALIIYTRVRIVRPLVCANCVHVYTIKCEYARAYICACTCIRVSLRLFTRKNTNAVSYVRMREFACVHCVRLRACLRTALIKTQNAQNISTLKRTLGSETFRMHYRSFCVHTCVHNLPF